MCDKLTENRLLFQFSQSLGNRLGLIQSKLPILDESSSSDDGSGQKHTNINIRAAASIAERCVDVFFFLSYPSQLLSLSNFFLQGG